jgi:hypothetical protein
VELWTPQSLSSIIWGSYNRPVVAAVPSGLSLTPLIVVVIIIISTILELYSEISASRKPFGIGHMCILVYIVLLLRMTDTITSQNIDLSSWDTLYIRTLSLWGRTWGSDRGSYEEFIFWDITPCRSLKIPTIRRYIPEDVSLQRAVCQIKILNLECLLCRVLSYVFDKLWCAVDKERLPDLFSWNKNSGAFVCQRTIPTKRPPLVGEVTANFSV